MNEEKMVKEKTESLWGFGKGSHYKCPSYKALNCNCPSKRTHQQQWDPCPFFLPSKLLDKKKKGRRELANALNRERDREREREREDQSELASTGWMMPLMIQLWMNLNCRS